MSNKRIVIFDQHEPHKNNIWVNGSNAYIHNGSEWRPLDIGDIINYGPNKIVVYYDDCPTPPDNYVWVKNTSDASICINGVWTDINVGDLNIVDPVRCLFEIEANPEDSVVVINDETRTSILANAGTEISWSVSKDHYITQSGTCTLVKDQHETVNLSVETHTFTVEPIPSNAAVTINGQEVNTLIAPYGTVANWTVIKDGYTSQSGSYIMNEDHTEIVELENVL